MHCYFVINETELLFNGDDIEIAREVANKAQDREIVRGYCPYTYPCSDCNKPPKED